MSPFLVLVTGGHDFQDRDLVFRTLDRLHEKHPNMSVLHGACVTGADQLAQQWAIERERPYIGVPAECSKRGREAVPVRNELMLHYAPQGVIAFPGGPGTKDMCDRSEKAGFKVWRVGS